MAAPTERGQIKKPHQRPLEGITTITKILGEGESKPPRGIVDALVRRALQPGKGDDVFVLFPHGNKTRVGIVASPENIEAVRVKAHELAAHPTESYKRGELYTKTLLDCKAKSQFS